MTPATPDPVPPIIDASGLTKHYDGRKVLDGVTLRLGPGETVAVLGANGSGKSTLLRLLSATSRPDEGRLHIAGLDAHKDFDGARRHLSLVPQDPPLYDELTAAEHLAWWARLTGRTADPAALLADAGLAPIAHRRAATLSRGQRQRVALCLAFLGDPPLVLLDEPFTALDSAGQAWLERQLTRRRGRQATVLALHGDAQAHRLADRVVHLQHHRLEATA